VDAGRPESDKDDHWVELAERLKRELAATTDDSRRSVVLNALARLQSGRLDQKAKALGSLEAAIDADSTDDSSLWDRWRIATDIDAEKRLAALDNLEERLTDPVDLVDCRLRQVHLLSSHIGDNENAALKLSAAAGLLPDHQGITWTAVEFAASQGDRDKMIEQLDSLISQTNDSRLRAALLTEVAALKRTSGRDPSEVSDALAAAIDEAQIDWTIAQVVLRMSADLDDWSLHERTLVRMAEAALEDEPKPPEGSPRGSCFQGFDHGLEASAGLWWRIAMVRERALNDSPGALAAIERSRKVLPEHPFLEIEYVRLLEVCGRSAEALDIVPDAAPDIWKAELALAAEQPQLALSLIYSGRNTMDSIFGSALAEMASDADTAPPNEGADQTELAVWFEKHLRHPEAVRIADRLEAEGNGTPITRLCIEEMADGEIEWFDADDAESDEPWPFAIEAVCGSPKKLMEAYLEWAERTSDLSLKATLISVAAHVAEEREGTTENVLDLHRRAEELDPDQAVADGDLLRIERSLGRWRELSDRLADTAALTQDFTESRVALHERALVLEHALDEPAEAMEVVTDLAQTDFGDIAAVWSVVRLAFRLGDWPLVLREIENLFTAGNDDRPFLSLLSGELELLAMGNLEEALQHFENASLANDETISQAARLYRFYALYQLGDVEGLDQALQEEYLRSPKELKPLWIPELLEQGRAVRGVSGVDDILEPCEDDTAFHHLWRVMTGLGSQDTKLVEQSLGELAQGVSLGDTAGACRATAALLGGRRPSHDLDFSETDVESPEVLWHTADRVGLDDDPSLLAEIYRERAEMAEEYDELEWVDWMLCRAEAEAKTGDKKRAFNTIHDALERSPEHPGLLEARVDYALSAKKYAEAADAHGRLARFYASEAEKADHLAQAAQILFEKLNEDTGAKNICDEALRRVPGHARAHDVLISILRFRGDEDGVAELLEQRIDTELDGDELVALYEEQADQKLMLDDFDGALEAIDSLISVKPEHISAYLTKIDLLAEGAKWEDVIATMGEYIRCSGDPVEVRTMTWRAADLIVEVMNDAPLAISWLKQLSENGDRHPETERKLAQIAKRADMCDEAVEALSRLAQLVKEPEQRNRIRREEATIHLEQLFDETVAGEIVEKILTDSPADLDTLKLLSSFSSSEEMASRIREAIRVTRIELFKNPVDLKLVAELRELALLSGEQNLVSLCDDVLLLLSGGLTEPWPGDLVPAKGLDAETMRRLFVHPDEANGAARVAEMAAGINQVAAENLENIPQVGRGTRMDPKEKIVVWIEAWAELLGYNAVEIHRAGEDSRGSIALPDGAPALAVSKETASPLSARHRFFLARNIWRSARGLGSFRDGDQSGPARWVVALTAVILGERIELPLPPEKELIASAKRAMPRRLRRSLKEPCELLLKENRQSLRDWAQATSYSADRFGLLAATRIAEVIPFIVEETLGPAGLTRMAEDPGATLYKVPRCLELLRFAMSDDYLVARQKLGLEVRDEGGGK
jgi:tetratricopeptide (TPR) repeat protein